MNAKFIGLFQVIVFEAAFFYTYIQIDFDQLNNKMKW